MIVNQSTPANVGGIDKVEVLLNTISLYILGKYC